MLLPKDWRAFIELLNSKGVEYLIVGAFALAYHGLPRYTGDLDILVRPTPENALRLESVLNIFGFSPLGLKAADFSEPDSIIQLGVAPNRIDILTSVTGVPFEEAWSDRIQAELDGIHANLIGRKALIRNKRLTGRTKDKADLEALGEDAE
jgi:hypothetical protein